MSDAELRELERRWSESGSDEDELRYRRARWRHAPGGEFAERWRLFQLLPPRDGLRQDLWPGLYEDAAPVDVVPYGDPQNLDDGLPRRWGPLLVAGPPWPATGDPPSYRAWESGFAAQQVLQTCPGLYYPRLPRARIEDELRQARQLEHEHLGRIVRFGFEPQAFLVFDPLGADRAVDASQPWELEPALRLVRALSDAVAAGHGQGLVHGAICLRAVRVRADGSPVLTPFGERPLSRFGPDDEHLARPARILPLGYFSPDQIMGHEGQPTCDVFALGLILYRLIVGQLPWTQGDTIARLSARLREPHPPVTAARPGLPQDLDHVLDKALVKESGEGYPAAGALRDDLDLLLAGEPVEPLPPTRSRGFLAAVRRFFSS